MEAPKKKRGQNSSFNYPCPVCDNDDDFTWGTPSATHGLYFHPDGQILGTEGLKMRKCNTCGNILTFSKKHII